MEAARACGWPVPGETERLGTLTDFGTVYRYEEYERAEGLDRVMVRKRLAELQEWAVEAVRR